MKTLCYVGLTRFAAVFMGILFMLTALGPDGVLAATITVVNANDSGPGSLRQAILDAKTNDKVNFAGDYVVLLDSPLTIDKSLTIDGTGCAIAIDGQKKVRIFHIKKSVTLIRLAIRNGQVDSGDGGAIWNGGDLAMLHCIISDNSANCGGGIWNGGKLAIQGVAFSKNSANEGGSIFNSGMLTMQDSILSDNAAIKDGGGIKNRGHLVMQSSTLSRNSADKGGGIFNNGMLTLQYNTLSDNPAKSSGGGIWNDGSLNMQICTLSGNIASQDGGGILNVTKGKLIMQGNTLVNNSPSAVSGGKGGCFIATMNSSLGLIGFWIIIGLGAVLMLFVMHTNRKNCGRKMVK